MEKVTWDARRTFSPNAWEILFVQEMNQCVLLLRQATGKSGCVCPLFTAHLPVPSVHSVLFCLISCWRFEARGWLSLGEYFQHRSGNQTCKGRVGTYLLSFAVVAV